MNLILNDLPPIHWAFAGAGIAVTTLAGFRAPARLVGRWGPAPRPLEPAPRLLGERREWIHAVEG